MLEIRGDEMEDNTNKYSKIITLGIIGCMLVLGLIVTISFLNKNQSSKNRNMISQEDVDVNIGSSSEEKILAVVKDINTDIKAISVMNINNGVEEVVYYTGGTDIRDKHDKVIAITQLNVGEIVDVYYKKGSNDLNKLQISKDAWEYREVTNFNIYSPKQTFQVGERKYRMNNRLVVAAENKIINLIDINEKDELMIKGAGNEIWSIIVTKGHGYIRLRNYEAFLGGTIEVGYQVMDQIVENMLIVVREGDYKVTLENGSLIGSKRVNILRNQEIVLDMREYRIEATKTGLVDFLIQPYGGVLYIDNELVDYERPIELEYGEHDIRVRLDGYTTYYGVLDVNESSKIVEIELAKEIVPGQAETTKSNPIESKETETKIEKEEIEETEEQPNTEAENKDRVDNKNSAPIVDNNHSIKVLRPEGADVYLNGVKKGTVPCDFAKEIGTHTITFAKSGYITKSYTILVVDDSEDATFSFPDMEK